MLDVELEQRKTSLENIGAKVSRANTEYTYMNGMPVGSVNMQFSSWHRSPNSNN